MPRHSILSALFALALIPPAFAATQQGDWTLYKVEGRDFVSMENVAEFYGLTGVSRTGGKGFEVRGGSRSFRGEVGSKDFFINNIKFILSFDVVEADGHCCVSRMDLTKLIEPVMRPQKIKSADDVRTVVLDAGHGGHDKGAWSPYGYEKDYTLDVARRTKALLAGQGYKVVMTRTDDTFIPLYTRCAIANKYKNALFISIHFNSGGAGTGLETYTLAPRGVPSMMADGPSVRDADPQPGHQNDAENMALATATHAALVVRSKLFDRGIKRARFVVLRETTIPAVLVEGGFLSHTYDAKIIAMPEYRQTMASSIVSAVNSYRRAVSAQQQNVASEEGAVSPRVRLNNEIAPRSEDSIPNTGAPVPATEN